MKAKDKKLTSVRLEPELYEDFKYKCLEDNFTFQKLASRAMYLYLKDDSFRKKILKQSTVKLK